MTNYVIASSKNWFDKHPKSEDYRRLNLVKITNKEDLNLEYLEKIDPRYIFFPHWNWKVTPEIYQRFECVVFHTAPLPYGRGGSPIQNLIVNGFKSSPVYALRMTEVLDSGPIYSSIEVSLEGTIGEIFQKIASAVEKLILFLCQENPTPSEQVGKSSTFKRLTISDNELLSSYSMTQLYDRIRMVDGEGYPNAYINFGDYKIEFSNAIIGQNELTANVRILRNLPSDIKIRMAESRDSMDILKWRNDPHSRSMFISSELVSEETHKKWFDNILNDPLQRLYVGEILDVKLGTCRFDLEPEKQIANVAINLSPSMRGKNLSKEFLQNSIKEYWKQHNVSLKATVRKNNEASLRLFKNCGFLKSKEDDAFQYFLLENPPGK